MWTTVALLTALLPGAGEASGLKLANVKFTYGIRGPVRAEQQFLPGDALFLAFDVDGARRTPAGQVKGAIGLEVLDEHGKLYYRQAPRDVTVEHPPKGSLPAYTRLQIGLEQPPGKYTLKVTVVDHVGRSSGACTVPFEVGQPQFGIVRTTLSADSQGKTPATAILKGRSFWINCELVGFARNSARQEPDVATILHVRDESGRAALAHPPGGSVGAQVPPRAHALPLQFVLRLQDAGRYTLVLEATDKVTRRKAVVNLPITVDAPPAVAVCATQTGTLLRRPDGTRYWEVVPQKGGVADGDLLVGLPGAVVESANRAVRLLMHSDFEGHSPYPAIESAVQLRTSPNVDLAVTLDRGRVELANVKPSGPARVAVHVRQECWELTLDQPGDRVALEMFSRWPRGVAFTLNPGPNDVPTARLVVLALKGDVVVKRGDTEHGLSAPPGPALLEWDSVNGQEESPRRLDRLPGWAVAGHEDSPAARAERASAQRLRQALASKPIGKTLEEFTTSSDPEDRRTAVLLLAALDEGLRLVHVLRTTKQPDVLDAGILALRHWIGRAPGQDKRLYDGLIERLKVTPAHAATFLYFLHTPGPVQLARPEIYQTLVAYLDAKEPLARALAYWHLYRLVPEGRALGYNPLDTKEARAAAIQKWRALIAQRNFDPGHDPRIKQ